MRTKIASGEVRRRLYKVTPVERAQGGQTYVVSVSKEIGIETGTIEVEVELGELVQKLGAKALGNKTGKASYMAGAIVARVVDRTQNLNPEGT